MEEVKSGSKETLIVDVKDKLGNLTDLASAAAHYDVKDRTGNYKLQNLVPVVVGLRAECLIDTTVGGVWTAEHYFLFLRFNASPDSPVLGPLEFKVV